MVDTVGKVGQPGERIQNVISVGMLSEGWDAKTVTHIMGLRAFTSQLLCEQVVGRGLRRTSYEVNPETGLFEPEYVNIFGVPFTFLPHEGGENDPPPPPTPKTAVEPDPTKAQLEIRWPNVVRIERVFQPTLTLDWSKVRPLELDAAQTAKVAELAPILEGKPDVTRINRIKLERLAGKFRTQRIIFETARDVFDQMKRTWRGSREVLLAQLVRIVEQFIRSDRIVISPLVFEQDELRRRLIITLNLSRVVQHIWEAVRQETTGGWARSSTAIIPSVPQARCALGTRASPASARRNPISTSASTTAHGKRPTPSRSTAVTRWLPGSRMTT